MEYLAVGVERRIEIAVAPALVRQSIGSAPPQRDFHMLGCTRDLLP